MSKEEQLILNNEKVALDILRYLDVKNVANVSQTCQKMYEMARKKKYEKIVLVDGGFKYRPKKDCVLRVTDKGYFVEIRLDDLEFSFNKPIRCGKTVIYSEVWITECRNDVENKKEHLWKFPDLPRESLRETTDERLGRLLIASERNIGKSYPWYILHKQKTLAGMLELYSRVLSLINP